MKSRRGAQRGDRISIPATGQARAHPFHTHSPLRGGSARSLTVISVRALAEPSGCPQGDVRLIGETRKVCSNCCRGDAVRQDICLPATAFCPVSASDNVLSDASRCAPIFDSFEFPLMAPPLLFAIEQGTAPERSTTKRRQT